MANCRGFFDRQLALIRPEFICCLGAVAAQTCCDTTEPIGRLRGRFYDYQGIRVMCTYHPAYLLRNPAAKKDVWEDMKMLMRRMGIELDRSSAAGLKRRLRTVLAAARHELGQHFAQLAELDRHRDHHAMVGQLGLLLPVGVVLRPTAARPESWRCRSLRQSG